MFFLFATGIIALVCGIFFLAFPNKLRKINAKASKLINRVVFSIDEAAYKSRTGVGISMILVAALCFFSVYYLAMRYGQRLF